MQTHRAHLRFIAGLSASLPCHTVRLATVVLAMLLCFCPRAATAMAATKNESILAPWLGSWRIEPEVTTDRDSLRTETGLVRIRINADGTGLEISRQVSQGSEIREFIIPDGRRRAIQENDCSGSQSYRWVSKPGVIVGHSEVDCNKTGHLITDSLKMMLSAHEMREILAVTSDGGLQVAIRRLSFQAPPSGSNEEVSVQEPSLEGSRARAALAADWTLQDIIRLAEVTNPAVLQAALYEKNTQVYVTADVLRKLADAKVPAPVIDLLVARAYPDKFIVEREGQVFPRATASPPAGSSWIPYPPGPIIYSGAVYLGCYSPYFGSACWTYYSPFWWDYPIYFGYPDHGSPRASSSGRLVARTGYIQVRRTDSGRHAVPRWLGGFSSSRSNPSPGNSADGGSNAGSSQSGSAPDSHSSGASASPGGYDSGGTSGRTAVPR